MRKYRDKLGRHKVPMHAHQVWSLTGIFSRLVIARQTSRLITFRVRPIVSLKSMGRH